MIPFMLTPIGRYITIGALILVVLGSVYVKIKSDAVDEMKAKATADALGRVQDAVRAGDSAVISPERLLETDGHRRD